MSTVQGARARARIEVTAAIKDEARRQLAADGATKLSLRAVARELGMVSSALYRYFPSRDDLLTALIVDAYDAVGEAAEHALAQQRKAAAPPAARWIAVCRAVRALGAGPPPRVRPHLRFARPRLHRARGDHRARRRGSGSSSSPSSGTPTRARASPRPPLAAPLRAEAERMAADFAPDLPPAVALALVAAWAQLFGLISFEVFGQFHRVVEDREPFFTHAAEQLARSVGLVLPALGPVLS